MTQYLPPDDDFEEGVSKITTHPTMWMRVLPWDSITAHPGWDWGVWSFSFLELFDRYFGAERMISNGTYTQLGATQIGRTEKAVRCGVVAYPYALGPMVITRVHGGQVYRNAFGNNVDLKAHFYTLTTGLVGENIYSVGSCGIGARIQGGTNYGTGTPDYERVTLLDGYWFVLGMASYDSTDPSCDFHLIRVNTGIATVLYTEVYDDSGGSGHYTKQALKGGAPFKLRMTVETNGGTVEIRCYHTPNYTFAPFEYGVERLSITYNDVSGSQITGPGRFGFFNSCEYYDATVNYAIPCCGYIQANALGGAIKFRDEWVRTNRKEAHFVDSYVPASVHTADDDAGGGYSLQSYYTNDNYGQDQQSYVYDTSLPVSAVDGLEFDFDIINAVNSGACGTTCISTRPADDPVKQDRSIDFYFDSTGGVTNKTNYSDWLDLPNENSARSAGIVLRATSYNHTSLRYPEPQIGYACSFWREDLTGYTGIEVYRYTQGLGRVTLATYSGYPTLALDTWYTARMKIDRVPGPSGTLNDAVEIKLYLDTVPVVLQKVYTGVTVTAAGEIYDERTDRILQGRGEGFRVNTADTAVGVPRVTYLDNWEQGADSGPEILDEADQASITVSREDDGATGTLTLNAGWPVSVANTYGKREHHFEYPEYRYANATMLKPRRVWTIGASAVEESETDALLVFWNAHHGVDRGFSWTTDEGETLTVHFMDGDLGTTLRAPSVTAFKIRLEELFDGS